METEGQRFSKQRKLIYDIVKGTKTHPDADWIYAAARESIVDISLGTVYRNLKLLTDAGLVHTLETTKGCIHYDADVSPHMHFICKNCGKIKDLPVVYDLKQKIEEKGYSVDSIKTVFYGTCDSCNKA